MEKAYISSVGVRKKNKITQISILYFTRCPVKICILRRINIQRCRLFGHLQGSCIYFFLAFIKYLLIIHALLSQFTATSHKRFQILMITCDRKAGLIRIVGKTNKFIRTFSQKNELFIGRVAINRATISLFLWCS